MKRLLFLSILLLSIISCISSKSAKNQNKFVESINSVIVQVNKLPGGDFEFIVENKTNQSIFIHNYYQVHVDRKVGDNWEKIRILNCPCGAPCARPEEYVEIQKENNFSIKWNLEESWCGEKNEIGVQETLSTKVGPGLYRIMVVYSFDKTDKTPIYQVFNI